ncbi:hypothetical protein ACH5RR_012935 [Cinchona calisaya]|uniref:Cytochrome c oxidase subunit 3 n=1 Tax=Cinchona calisaya TaxID=153742 RepID=A0ABD2ZZ28_9GENT
MAYFGFTRSFDNNRRGCDVHALISRGCNTSQFGPYIYPIYHASSHSSLASTVEIGGIWPPKGIEVLDPWEIRFLNTLIPPLSRAALTWAHHAILAGREKRAVYALVATILLALVFTGFQGMEYYQAPFTISDSTLFLIICGIRQYVGHLAKEHHIGFKAAACQEIDLRIPAKEEGGYYFYSNSDGERLILRGRHSRPPLLNGSILIENIDSGSRSSFAT